MTRFLRLSLMLCVALLTACSSMRRVDNDVTSFARWQAAPGPVTGMQGSTYRFERLPSQEHIAAGGSELGQAQLETLTQQALERRGLVLQPDAAALIVQVGMTSVVQPGGYASSMYGGPGVALGTGTGGSFIGLSFPVMRYEPPAYLRELSLVLRDSRNNAVVYETRARHSGPWADARAIWPAMLEAALNGFPNPPVGTRRVKVEIPR